MDWTDDENTRLVELWTTGKPASAIAGEIGKTRDAVLGRVHRLGLPKRRDLGTPRALIVHTPQAASATGLSSSISGPVEPEPPLKPEPSLPAIATNPDANVTPLPLWELRGTHCRWPVNDGGPFLFCCAKQVPGRPYCAFHVKKSKARP